jgi:hypothetical protein
MFANVSDLVIVQIMDCWDKCRYRYPSSYIYAEIR